MITNLYSPVYLDANETHFEEGLTEARIEWRWLLEVERIDNERLMRFVLTGA
jgi:hypothetical protein